MDVHIETPFAYCHLFVSRIYDATIGGKAFYEEIWHPVTATGCQFWYRDRLRLPPAFILASGDLLTIKALLAPSTAPAVPASPAVSPA